MSMLRTPVGPSVFFVLALCAAATGQTAPSTQGAAGLIRLNLPEKLELAALVDYVSARVGVNIIYDELLDGKTVSLSSPVQVSPDELLGLLQAALRSKGLALIDATPRGWKRIAPSGEAPGYIQTQFVTPRNADAADIAQQLKQLMAARQRAQPGSASPGGSPGVEVSVDPRTGQVVMLGPGAGVEEARRIIGMLDVAIPQEQSPVRFYKLANATALDVLETIRSLEGDDAAAPARGSATSATPAGALPLPERSTHAMPGTPGLLEPVSPSGSSFTGQGQPSALGKTSPPPAARSAGNTQLASPANRPAYGGAETAIVGGVGASGAPQAVRARQATVTADANTNSIIVIGPPAVQRMYEQLIKSLDKRRPQVLVEATIVTLDTSDNFSLGVDVGIRASIDSTDVITFSSFGISQVNVDTGRLALTPGVGFNGAVLNSDVADIVL
ncbi:MAG: hypothetical protein H0X11_11090, partial [Betaproteobacteria bacterium]|nr:hypothetical protein [Betaproteobacteria bacterium]